MDKPETGKKQGKGMGEDRRSGHGRVDPGVSVAPPGRIACRHATPERRKTDGGSVRARGRVNGLGQSRSEKPAWTEERPPPHVRCTTFLDPQRFSLPLLRSLEPPSTRWAASYLLHRPLGGIPCCDGTELCPRSRRCAFATVKRSEERPFDPQSEERSSDSDPRPTERSRRVDGRRQERERAADHRPDETRRAAAR